MSTSHQKRRSAGPGRRGGGDGRARDGASGAPVAVRGGGVSESVAKAPRGGIGREKKRGISTILLRLSGAMGAFATDLDKQRRRGPREGWPWAGRRPRRAPRRPRGPRGRRPGPRGRAPAPPARRGSPVDAPRRARKYLGRARSSLNPRERLLEVRARGLSDVLAGYPAISRTAAPTSPAPPASRRALRIRKCSGGVRGWLHR